MSKAHWHFPRSEFAETVYGLLANGPVQAVSLFGPRRTGKTQFLTHDLAPLAEDKGHRVVYASLWQTLESPLAMLLYEFDLALRTGSFLDRVKSAAGDIAPKFKLKSPDGIGEVEIDLSKLKGEPPESHLLLLDQYCERLASDDKPAFLLFDEFQELTRAPSIAPLIASLRTSLDKRKDSLVAVFTGSSQEGLRKVFSAREAPFFRFATPLTLPTMDNAFVEHQLKVFKETSKAKVDRTKAIEIFARFDNNPFFFQRWLITLAINPTISEQDAIDSVQQEIAEEFVFVQQWLSLNDVQRATARMLAERIDQIYGKEGATFIQKLTSNEAPTASAIQSAVTRLSRLGLVDKWEDAWRIGDPLFESWIKDRPLSDF